MTDDTVEIRFIPDAISAAAREFYATRLVGSSGWFMRYGFFLAMGLALLGSLLCGYILFCINPMDPPGFRGFVMGALTMMAMGFGGTLLFQAALSPIRRRAFRADNERRIALSADGIEERWGQSRAMISWRDVVAVRSWSTALVIVLGESRSTSLALDALPQSLSPEDLVERIQAWREAVR